MLYFGEFQVGLCGSFISSLKRFGGHLAVMSRVRVWFRRV